MFNLPAECRTSTKFGLVYFEICTHVYEWPALGIMCVHLVGEAFRLYLTYIELYLLDAKDACLNLWQVDAYKRR